jgi:regulator of replication initiation timing
MEMAAAIGDGINKYIKQIEQENRELKQALDENTKQRKELEAENQRLEEKLQLALFRQFGRASERFIGKGQQPANLRFDVWE